MSLPWSDGKRRRWSCPRASAQLAHRLLVSLDEDAVDDPAEVERAWEEEIRRRLAGLEAATVDLIPAEEVFAELRTCIRL